MNTSYKPSLSLNAPVNILPLFFVNMTSYFSWLSIMDKVSYLLSIKYVLSLWDISPTYCLVIGLDSMYIWCLLSTLRFLLCMTLQNSPLQSIFYFNKYNVKIIHLYKIQVIKVKWNVQSSGCRCTDYLLIIRSFPRTWNHTYTLKGTVQKTWLFRVGALLGAPRFKHSL